MARGPPRRPRGARGQGRRSPGRTARWAARGQRFDLVAQLRIEHGRSWQRIGAELNITKQGAVKVYAEHVKDHVRRKTAADRARFETVRPSAPVASPAVDVPLDLDEDAERG
jgi:hypothetical protein